MKYGYQVHGKIDNSLANYLISSISMMVNRNVLLH